MSSGRASQWLRRYWRWGLAVIALWAGAQLVWTRFGLAGWLVGTVVILAAVFLFASRRDR